MKSLTRDDLLSLERYAEVRSEFRAKVMADKASRRLHLGEHCTLVFENRHSIQYQIQEMLRIERIFEAAGIQEELDAYNPLIPDGSNLKATMLIEYEDVAERRVALEQLKGVEQRVWLQVEGFARCFAIADEDMERANEEKTSAVHFLRFEFPAADIAAAKAGAALRAGIDHAVAGNPDSLLPDAGRTSLVGDFD